MVLSLADLDGLRDAILGDSAVYSPEACPVDSYIRRKAVLLAKRIGKTEGNAAIEAEVQKPIVRGSHQDVPSINS